MHRRGPAWLAWNEFSLGSAARSQLPYPKVRCIRKEAWLYAITLVGHGPLAVECWVRFGWMQRKYQWARFGCGRARARLGHGSSRHRWFGAGNGYYYVQSIGALRGEHDYTADCFAERVPRLSRKDIRGSKPDNDQGGDCLGQDDL